MTGRRPRIVLGAVTALGAVAMVLVFAIVPARTDRWFEPRVVTQGEIETRNDPWRGSGVTSRLQPGCSFYVTRRRAGGWVWVEVDIAMAGWVEDEAVEKRSSPQPR